MEIYIGTILQVPFNFAPQGWLMCDGSLQSIASFEALYALIGTTYGGDGTSTFGLPDFRGRMPVHVGSSGGSSYALGQMAGTESVTLTAQQNATHTHSLAAQSAVGTAASPQGNYFAGSAANIYGTSGPNTTASMLTSSGGSQSHENRMPSLALNFIIATDGLYPPFN